MVLGYAIRRSPPLACSNHIRRAFSGVPSQSSGAASSASSSQAGANQTPASGDTVKLGARDFWRWFNTAPDKKSASWAQKFRRGSHSYKRIVTALSILISMKLIYNEEKKNPQLLQRWLKIPAQPIDMTDINQWNNVVVPVENQVEHKEVHQKYYT
jgi:hypothetical protein